MCTMVAVAYNVAKFLFWMYFVTTAVLSCNHLTTESILTHSNVVTKGDKTKLTFQQLKPFTVPLMRSYYHLNKPKT